MSYRVTVHIVCDHGRCREALRFDRDNRGGLSKTNAGYDASRSGWYVRGRPGSNDPRVAYCPEHRAAHGHPAPAPR